MRIGLIDVDAGKTVLDATCGSRMMWFDKHDPRCLYIDRRIVHEEAAWKSTRNQSVRHCDIEPDVVADFTALPFPDESFYLVVFDPPHLTQISDAAWMCKKYGRLPQDWRAVIHDGFKECMRVLKKNGTLIFKWCEYNIPTREVIEAVGYKPLFGHISGKKSMTHWMAFIKE